MKLKLQTLYTRLMSTIVILAMSACGSTKLLDIDKTAKTLQLSEVQRNVVQSKVEQIEQIVEDYELDRETLKSEMAQMRATGGFGGRSGGFGGGPGGGPRGGSGGGGGRGDLQNKMRAFYQQRTEYQKQINAFVVEIQEILEEEQREAFSDIKLPELEMPDIGRGGRGGGSGGGGRRRGGGGFGGGFGR
jgi:hypothetical protein